MSAAPDKLPVSVITGFLGSGKTTLISRLLMRPDLHDTAVIVSEFGEIALDHDLVQASDETTVLLTTGCLCCASRGDLPETLDDLWLRRRRGEVPPFARVLMETSGLADPAPILHTLMGDRVVTTLYALDAVVTLVDAVLGEATLARHPESVKQVAVADRLVLTKLDLAADAAALRARLRDLNAAAPIVESGESGVDPRRLFGASPFRPTGGGIEQWLGPARSGAHSGDIAAHCFTLDRPVSGAAFSEFLERLSRERGEDLLRVKGILDVAERPGTPAVIHGVQHVFHPVIWLPAWPGADRRSRLVFITRGIPREAIAALLAPLGLAESPGAARHPL